MYITHAKGELAQLKVQVRAAEKGITVSRPTVEARYDLILDFDGKLERAQIKYGNRWAGGALQVDLRKEARNNGIVKTYSSKEVDALYVYVAQRELILRIPVSVFDQRKSLTFRFEETKNNQMSGVTMAALFVW